MGVWDHQPACLEHHHGCLGRLGREQVEKGPAWLSAVGACSAPRPRAFTVWDQFGTMDVWDQLFGTMGACLGRTSCLMGVWFGTMFGTIGVRVGPEVSGTMGAWDPPP